LIALRADAVAVVVVVAVDVVVVVVVAIAVAVEEKVKRAVRCRESEKKLLSDRCFVMLQ
jgi:hypothetical protein